MLAAGDASWTPCAPHVPWQCDIQVEVAALETTGGKVWRAARELCAFLEQRRGELGLGAAAPAAAPAPSPAAPSPAAAPRGAAAAPGVAAQRGGADGGGGDGGVRRVLEIGAGCGWLGLCLARNVPDLEVVLTEQPAGLGHLERNIQLNRDAGAPVQGVRADVLDWGAVDSGGLAQQRWDLVIGSDLLYAESALADLPALLGRLAGPATRVLYAHTLHRYDHLDVEFFKALEASGLRCREVGDVPPEGEAFLEELFPEERAAVFEISHASGPSRCLLPALAAKARRGDLPAELGGARCGAASGEAPPAALCAAPAAASAAERARDLGVHVVLPEEDAGAPAGGAGRPPSGEESHAGVPTLRLAVVGPFGNASHPTTRLVLRWLASPGGRAAVAGAQVCDYGCGSGVLGLAALLHGAAACVAVDNDPAALRATRANAAANSLPLRVHLPPSEVLQRDLDFYSRFGDWRQGADGWSPLDAPLRTSAPPSPAPAPSTEQDGCAPTEALEEQESCACGGGGCFGAVLCNIVVGPLCQVAPTLGRLCRPGGVVALAGFRGSYQREQVEAAYRADFDLQEASSEGGWLLLVGRRRGGA